MHKILIAKKKFKTNETVDLTNKCFCPMTFRKKLVKSYRREGIVRGLGFPAVDILIPKAQITSSRFPFAHVEIFSPIWLTYPVSKQEQLLTQ